MSDQLHFGIQTTATWPWPEMVALWQRAEALGFESAWLPDHLVPPFNPTGPIYEAWTLLTGLATATTTLRLGVLVSCNTFREPVVVAKQAVTLDHISGGRLEFGLGAGWFQPEHDMFGIELPAAKPLVARFREAVELCDQLMSLPADATATYAGHFYQVTDAPFRPRPVQQPRIPFTLGAHGPKMLAIVARHAQRWNSTGTVAEMAERNRVLDEQCAAIDRDPATILRSHLFVPSLLPDEHPWDSPETFYDFVGRFQAAGVREFLLQPPRQEPMAALERLSGEVMARARALGTGTPAATPAATGSGGA